MYYSVHLDIFIEYGPLVRTVGPCARTWCDTLLSHFKEAIVIAISCYVHIRVTIHGIG